MSLTSASLIPEIVQGYHRQTPWEEWISGTVMFADVSGFTPMSEALSVLGAEGAELLTDILNRYFSAMIGIIHVHDGQIMKFGGDAILCFFPGAETLHRTLYAAQEMQQSMAHFQNIRTSVRSFALKMKIGISVGDVLLAGVGDPSVRCDYVFAGQAVDETSEAEHHATADQIVVKCHSEKLEGYKIVYKTIEKDYFLIENVPPLSEKKHTKEKRNSPNQSYLIKEIVSLLEGGYDRYIGSLQNIVPVFLQFTGYTYSRETFSLQSFHNFFSRIMALTHQYHGRLNRINMGDKGSTFFILFGAPAFLEKKELLACAWALDIRRMVEDEFPHVTLKIGKHSGRVFAGLVGNTIRSDYTVMGDTVNFAARLMQGTGKNEINTSKAIKELCDSQFNFSSLGKKSFKGKKERLPVFRLESRNAGLSSPQKGNTVLIGRDREFKEILNAIRKAKEGSSGFIVLEGAAGLGKSTLSAALLRDIREQNIWTVVAGRGDVTLQNRMYSPWRECLESLLFEDDKPSISTLRTLLKTYCEEGIAHINLFVDFFQIATDEVSDSSSVRTFKKGIFHHLVSVLLLNFSRTNPLFISFEDLHWFDSLSMELLQSILEHLSEQPLCIMATTRPNWQKTDFVHRPNVSHFEVEQLSKKDLSAIAEELLHGPIHATLTDFLYNQTRGNPFFATQLTLYLHSESMLETSFDRWKLKQDVDLEKSLTSEEIILSLIERLSFTEKLHLKAASIIGSIFQQRVLQKIIEKQYSQKILEQLVRKGFLIPHKKDSFIFYHALIQDTLYHSVPLKMRKSFHGKIGKSLELLYAHSLDEFFPNLANHFYLAENQRPKAVDYSIKTAYSFYKMHLWMDSIKFFRRSYELLRYTSDRRKWTMGFMLCENLIQIRKPAESLSLNNSLKRSIRRKKPQNLDYLLCVLQTYKFNAQQSMNDFSYLHEALNLLQMNEVLTNDLIADIHYYIGVAYYRTGQSEKALKYLQKTLAIKDSNSNRDILFSTYSLVTAIKRGMLNLEDANEYIEEALSLAGKYDLDNTSVMLKIEKVNIRIMQGNVNEAKNLYLEIIDKCDQTGQTYLLGISYLNLAKLLVDLQNFHHAREYLNEAYKILSRLSERNAQALVLNLFGIIHFHKNEFEKAYAKYSEALKKIEESGDLNFIAELYYNLAESAIKLSHVSKAGKWINHLQNIAERTSDPLLQEDVASLNKLLDSINLEGVPSE